MNETPKSPATEDLPELDRRASGEKPATAEARIPLIPEAEFDEAGYLRLNPDVRKAVDAGRIRSGYAHYISHGNDEGRLLPGMPREPRNIAMHYKRKRPVEGPLPEATCAVDDVTVAPDGGIMVTGWIDDAAYPLDCIRVLTDGWRAVIDSGCILRVRREDVEKAIGRGKRHAFGFIAYVHLQDAETTGPVTVELWQTGERVSTRKTLPAAIDAENLRDAVLERLATARFHGDAVAESIAQLDRGLGEQIIALNRVITQRFAANPYVESFGPPGRRPRTSIVVSLRDKVAPFFVQNCLFAGTSGIEDYEFIYVCESPEMAEALLREARSADLIYGLGLRVMILPGRIGVGAAANIAARIVQCKQLILLDPEVVPRECDWAQKHAELLASAPEEQTCLFGVPLYYSNGALAHAGIDVKINTKISFYEPSPRPINICQVSCLNGGAPSGSLKLLHSRPVSAVSTALMSIQRSWFDELGGLDEDYIAADFVGADFCLKSKSQGKAAWLHDLPMWKCADERTTHDPAHRGRLIVGCWLLSRKWGLVNEGEPLGKRHDSAVSGESGDKPRTGEASDSEAAGAGTG